MRAIVGISWPENPLRDSIERLSADQQVAMLLDRNVDPGKNVTVSGRATLEQTIDRLAEQNGLTCCYVGPVVYLAPPPIASGAVLADVREAEAKQLPPRIAVRVAERRPVRWEMLAEPRALVERAATEYGLRVAGLERIPHDLWREAELPPLTLAERLTLLLAGFRLTFEWSPDGTEIRLAGVDDSAVVERNYEAVGDAARSLAELRRTFPDVTVQRTSGGVRVRGKLADHLAIERSLRGADQAAAAVGPPAGGTKTYSLTLENKPAGAVVSNVANLQGWQLRIAADAEPILRSLVSFKVVDASLDELLAKTLDPLGLSWRVADGSLEIDRKQD